jgi:hypothetical protein
MMKKIIVLVAMLMVVTSVSAFAFTSLGDSQVIGSWQAQFEESGNGQFNQMRIKMVTPGVLFEGPGFSNLASDWSTSLLTGNNAAYVVADGPTIPSQMANFYIKFAPDISVPFMFKFQSLYVDGGIETVKTDAWMSWSGSDFNWGNASGGTPMVADPPAAVPEASTLIGFGSALLMAGPGMIGWLRRRRA